MVFREGRRRRSRKDVVAVGMNFRIGSKGYAGKTPMEMQAFEMHVFHHIKGYVKAIREAFRVLKPGGRFTAIDLGRHFFSPMVARFFPPEITFTRGEFAAHMRTTGFKIETEWGGERSFMVIGVKPS